MTHNGIHALTHLNKCGTFLSIQTILQYQKQKNIKILTEMLIEPDLVTKISKPFKMVLYSNSVLKRITELWMLG